MEVQIHDLVSYQDRIFKVSFVDNENTVTLYNPNSSFIHNVDIRGLKPADYKEEMKKVATKIVLQSIKYEEIPGAVALYDFLARFTDI